MKSGVRVRSWEAGDAGRLAAAAPHLSTETLRDRFWVGVPTLPSGYLRSIERRWPRDWDAVVALAGDDLIGWAEFGRNPHSHADADIGICVVDARQRQGIGTLLLEALLPRVPAAGITVVHADIEPGNRSARVLWRKVTSGAGIVVPADGYGRHALVLATAPALQEASC